MIYEVLNIIQAIFTALVSVIGALFIFKNRLYRSILIIMGVGIASIGIYNVYAYEQDQERINSQLEANLIKSEQVLQLANQSLTSIASLKSRIDWNHSKVLLVFQNSEPNDHPVKLDPNATFYTAVTIFPYNPNLPFCKKYQKLLTEIRKSKGQSIDINSIRTISNGDAFSLLKALNNYAGLDYNKLVINHAFSTSYAPAKVDDYSAGTSLDATAVNPMMMPLMNPFFSAMQLNDSFIIFEIMSTNPQQTFEPVEYKSAILLLPTDDGNLRISADVQGNSEQLRDGVKEEVLGVYIPPNTF